MWLRTEDFLNWFRPLEEAPKKPLIIRNINILTLKFKKKLNGPLSINLITHKVAAFESWFKIIQISACFKFLNESFKICVFGMRLDDESLDDWGMKPCVALNLRLSSHKTKKLYLIAHNIETNWQYRFPSLFAVDTFFKYWNANKNTNIRLTLKDWFFEKGSFWTPNKRDRR